MRELFLTNREWRLEIQGKGTVEAALKACHLRLRPIVMTSVAFIAGCVPLLLGHGAGSEVRQAIGVTVLAGMLGVPVRPVPDSCVLCGAAQTGHRAYGDRASAEYAGGETRVITRAAAAIREGRDKWVLRVLRRERHGSGFVRAM
jgi:hypothetical protein